MPLSGTPRTTRSKSRSRLRPLPPSTSILGADVVSEVGRVRLLDPHEPSVVKGTAVPPSALPSPGLFVVRGSPRRTPTVVARVKTPPGLPGAPEGPKGTDPSGASRDS